MHAQWSSMIAPTVHASGRVVVRTIDEDADEGDTEDEALRGPRHQYGAVLTPNRSPPYPSGCVLCGETITKIIVTHHPFHIPMGHDENDVVGRAPGHGGHCRSGVDLLLAGHLHVSHRGYTDRGRSALIVGADTATSTRGRGESNSFNLMQIEAPYVCNTSFDWQPSRAAFFADETEALKQTTNSWVLAAEEPYRFRSIDRAATGLVPRL